MKVVATERVSILARDANPPHLLLDCLQPSTVRLQHAHDMH